MPRLRWLEHLPAPTVVIQCRPQALDRNRSVTGWSTTISTAPPSATVTSSPSKSACFRHTDNALRPI